MAEFPECGKALAKYRINPGNVGKGAKGDEKFAFMIRTAAENNKAVRIGVNWGSLDQGLAKRMMDANLASATPKPPEEIMKEALIVSALESAEKSRGFRFTRRQNHFVVQGQRRTRLDSGLPRIGQPLPLPAPSRSD